MEKYLIILSIIAVLVLGVLGGVDVTVPDSIKIDAPDEFEQALQSFTKGTE